MDDGGSPYIGLCLLAAFIVFHAVFYGFLAALDNLNESLVEKLAKDNNPKAEKLLVLTDRPSGSIHTLQFLITGICLLAGVVLSMEFNGSKRICFIIIYWILLTVFGTFGVRKIAARKAEKWGMNLCGFIVVITKICFPILYLFECISDITARLCGVDPKKDLDDVTEEEIISMVKEGHQQGVLLASEAEMIHNIFEFGDKEAKDIMTHRKNITALDGDMPFEEALHFMMEANNSRFPVYIDDIDNVVGVLHIKEALQNSQKKELFDIPIKDVKGLVHDVDYIPETRNINILFKEMQSEKTHMVIVVDEYGQTSGIVAMEDILEEIVGNILDEHDEDDEMIINQYDGSYLINGMADFEDVAEILNISVEDDDYETLNGFLISKIDKIPSEDEQISVNSNGYCFKVQKVENKMIQRVYVTKLLEDINGDGSSDSSCQNKESMVE